MDRWIYPSDLNRSHSDGMIKKMIEKFFIFDAT